MVSKAINWINALATIWKVLAAIIIFVASAGASVGAAYAMWKAEATSLHATDHAIEGRVDKLEANDDAQYEERVKSAEKERLARERLHAVESESTNEYRKEMRDRMRVQESVTSGIQATLEQIDKRIP